MSVVLVIELTDDFIPGLERFSLISQSIDEFIDLWRILKTSADKTYSFGRRDSKSVLLHNEPTAFPNITNKFLC